MSRNCRAHLAFDDVKLAFVPASGAIAWHPPERGVYAAETFICNYRHRDTEVLCIATLLRTEVRAPAAGLRPNAPSRA